MSLNPEDKVVRQRLSVLELAQALGNVSEACRQRGVTRSQFYEYKKRFAAVGLAGLKGWSTWRRLFLYTAHVGGALACGPCSSYRGVGRCIRRP
jgi:ACT domain-containing protein